MSFIVVLCPSRTVILLGVVHVFGSRLFFVVVEACIMVRVLEGWGFSYDVARESLYRVSCRASVISLKCLRSHLQSTLTRHFVGRIKIAMKRNVSPHATFRRTHKNSDETGRFRDVSEMFLLRCSGGVALSGVLPCVCHFFEMPKVALVSHPHATYTHTSMRGEATR